MITNIMDITPQALRVVKPDRASSIQNFETSPIPIFENSSHDIAKITLANDPSEVTPRAVIHTVSNKSSSYKILRIQTPKLLARLRSFSNGRQQGCRSREQNIDSFVPHHPARLSSLDSTPSTSTSSSSERPYDPHTATPLCHDEPYASGPYRGSSLPPFAHATQDLFLDPVLLIPQIRIIPAMTTVSNGQATV